MPRYVQRNYVASSCYVIFVTSKTCICILCRDCARNVYRTHIFSHMFFFFIFCPIKTKFPILSFLGPALLRARNVRVDQRDAVWCFCFASLATMCQPVSDWNDEAHILAKDHHFASCLFLSCRSAFRLHRQLQYRLFPVQRTRHLRKLRHVSHPESSSP